MLAALGDRDSGSRARTARGSIRYHVGYVSGRPLQGQGNASPGERADKAKAPRTVILRQPRSFAAGREQSSRTDGELLRAFLDSGREPAFEEIVRRHGSTQTSHDNLYATPHGQQRQDAFEERLRDNTLTPVPEQAAFRIDFPAWRGTRNERDRRVVDDLMAGGRTKDVSRKFEMSPGRVSQLRREFREDWRRFPAILSPTGLAGLLGLSVKTVYEWSARGRACGRRLPQARQARPHLARPRPRPPLQRKGLDPWLTSPPAGRDGGFTLHSLRHFFETFAVNEGIPQRVVDSWLGHRSDRSMAAVYYKLKDEDSQRFMAKVPFGTGLPTAGVGAEE